MKTRFLVKTSLAAVCMFLLSTTGILAQDINNGNESEIEEITVTARYRKESLQDIPLSETVFTAKDIQDARIDEVGDFISLTPNVTIAQAQNAGTSFLTIRGITQVRNGEPPVAVVIDGVQQVSPNQFAQELFDLESIEVVRGPQGALYGRNATGGAIVITTQQPTEELEGNVRAGFGNGGEYLAQASFKGPLVNEKLYFRAGMRYHNIDGYYTNINIDKKVDYLEDFTFRGLLKWVATEKLVADLRINFARLEGGANNFVYQPTIFGPDGITLSTDAPFNYPFDFSKLDANDTSIPYTANNLGYNSRDIDELVLKLDYQSDAFLFTSATSWNHVEEFLSTDQYPYTNARSYYIPAYFSNVDGTVTQYLDTEAWSEDLRWTSSSDQRLRWMGGLYYLKTDRFISTVTGNDLGLGILKTKRLPAPPDSTNPTNAFLADDNDNKAWAVYGQLNYDIVENLELSGALRYDDDSRKQTVSPYLTGVLIGTPGAVNKASFNKWQPKVTLRYTPKDNLNFYTSWGEGFRSGQFNQNGVSEVAENFGLLGLQDVAGQEITKSWEIGMKSEVLEHRLRINAALFDTKVYGQQYFVFIPVFNAQVLENINKVALRGGEIELTAIVAEGFDAYASVGYTDSKIKEYDRVPADIGNRAPYVPKYTFNIGAQYRTALTDSFGLFTRADFEKRGKQYWDPENSTARNALNLLRLRLGVESANDTWSLIGTVDNALDEEYNSEWVGGGFAHIAPPRTWRIDFSYNF